MYPTKTDEGQKFMRELITALDALPEKRLITDLLSDGSDCCALGAVGRLRGVTRDEMYKIGDDGRRARDLLCITRELADSVTAENDYFGELGTTPRERWQHMRAWAESQLMPVAGGDNG